MFILFVFYFLFLFQFVSGVLYRDSNDNSRQISKIENDYTFSFEVDMEDWDANATDLELGDTLIDWSIERTQEEVGDGNYSLRLYLENSNDAGKIWIQRPFIVDPKYTYRVDVEYLFASADFGDVNHFTIITGVLQQPPQTREDLVYQGSTGNGFSSDTGYVWLEKDYSFDVSSSPDSTLWVIIGIWGTWETPRTYYLDSVNVSFTEGSEVFVEDNDISMDYVLYENYPNPFNPSTIISYSIPKSDFVTLKIYDMLGRETQTLVSEFQNADTYFINFDVNKLSSGIYFYKLQVGNEFVKTKKMLLIR